MLRCFRGAECPKRPGGNVASCDAREPVSGGAKEGSLERAPGRSALVFRSFLAGHAGLCPRYRGEPLQIDVLLAVEADPKPTGIDAVERRLHVAPPGGFSLEMANCQLAHGSVLDSV